MNNRLSCFVLCLVSLCLFAFCLEPLEARAEEPEEVTSEELSETTAESSSACICRIDVTAYSNLPDNCISVKNDLGESKVQYKVGKSKWKSVTGLERDEAGSYLIGTTAGESISVRVKKGKDVVGTNASFGIDTQGETRNGGMRPPYGFDHSAFMNELFADGFTFTAEDGARVVVELTKENNGPGSSPVNNPKYYVYFDKNATVSKDGKTVTTKGPSGEKIIITIDGAKVEDGRVGIPEDESKVVFYMGGDFNPKKMSVYVMERKENLTYDPMLIDLYVATGSNAVTLAKHWPEDGHFTNEMTFGIGGDPSKTYTPSTPFPGPESEVEGTTSVKESADEGLIYKLDKSGTATFMGTNSTAGTLTILSRIRVYNSAYDVTAIEKNACKDNKKLKTVAIPLTVKSIGTSAFKGASGLKTVKISADTSIKIGKNAFSGIKSKAVFKITATSGIFKKIKKKISSAGAPSEASYKRKKPVVKAQIKNSDTSNESNEGGLTEENNTAATGRMERLDIDYEVYDVGSYSNWEGVTNLSLLTSSDGTTFFALDRDNVVMIFGKTETELKEPVFLTKYYPQFGGVVKEDGFYYLVTGESREDSGTGYGAVAVSKFDLGGVLYGTIDNDGGSSLDWNDTNFLTAVPFEGGNCSIAVNNGILAVHYARKMISGHQSNSLLLIDTRSMTILPCGRVYQSHSFGQRVVKYDGGFLLVSEGDCYDRAFVLFRVDANGTVTNYEVFRFGVQKGALDRYDMHVLNDNFAHLGDIAITGSGRAILAGTSARSMSESAALEKEDIFIQIFDPTSDLSDRSAYFGGEERTGLSGGNGDKECTDHGVRWITKLDPDETIKNLHCVVTENNTVVLLYEKYRDFGTYEGVFYMFLDEDGNIIQEETMYRSLTHLQGGETPLCSGNTVWWLGNEGTDPILCLYSIIVQ